MINLRIIYQVVTPESAEYGEYADSGIECECATYTFRELVELLEQCENSNSGWATQYNVDFDFKTGAETSFSYHPISNRDKRYFEKACHAAGI